MRLSSPNLSDSPPPRRISRRRRPPPSSSSTHSQTPDNISDTQFDSYSSISTTSSSSSSSPPPLLITAVIPLPIFRGLPGECPISHLTLFNRLFNASSSSSSLASNFPITLLDDAALWYELAVETHPSISWDETKSAFLRAFRPPESNDMARAELVSLRQRDGESVNSYHLRMQWILKRWPGHGLPESLLRGLFLDGLRVEFHDWVLPRKPQTVEEALRLAMDWEGARVVVSRGGEVRCGFCEGRHGEKECEVRRRMREEWLRRRRREGEKEEEEEAEEEERLGRVVSIGSVGRRSSQCQCSKHQCWKKYERTGSAVTVRTVNAAAAAAAAPVVAASVAE